ncbi:hexitol phosphatase HxpB [Chryseobacterium sp. ISL-6]|uniref:hexitol phosphatase HxpB n=1 Tax=Chryseobacterium sp. ISL-6 TaxID=2819143 RepID=UPI001BEA2E77|nr:hexitol phosphatase HxpB [Chryseobacterium sp. ISL-6]MBT2621125.1 hexitol phosphatase HxpB [Chryseobacterium sp. ISL-6]
MDIKSKRAVIFDMDGVLIDSEKFWKQAEYEVFSSLGVEVTEELSKHTQSMTTSEVARFWHEKYPWENAALDVIEQQVISRVIELIQTEECSVAGIKKFIEDLKLKQYKIGLATNSPYRIIQTVLDKIRVTHLFDHITSAEFEKQGKPHPAVYFTSAKNLDVDPQFCFVIEDSHSGIIAAKNAGMTVIAFTNQNPDIYFDLADDRIISFEGPLPAIFN